MSTQLILYFSFLILHLTYCEQPRVTIENGIVVGKYRISYYGEMYQSFEGIPYAKPPIDDRRFKEPEPLRGKWIGEWNATEPGSPCLQYDHFTRRRSDSGDWIFSVVGDEDCLFLNVYTKNGEPNKDVVVLIHGGAFMFGCGHVYGPDYIIDMPNIVVVTANYRLGPLGFLTTGDSLCPGNNGLKDQTLVLKWVQNNIAAFGGDPNKVTIVGLSAGGASVHYHYLSEMSQGLFTRGFSFSGNALCPWAFVRDGVSKTEQLAESLGCPITDSKSLLKCLRRRPARKIVEKVKDFQNWLYNPFNVFGPVMESDSSRPFIDDEPRNLLKQNRVQDKPWITSFTSEDGLYPAGDFVDNEKLLQNLEENWNLIAPSLLFYNPSKEKKPIARVIKQYYLGKNSISKNSTKELIKMLSDRLFIAPAVEAASLQAQANTQPVYLYAYEYEGTLSTSQIQSETNNKFGVAHGDDFSYVIKFCDRHTHINDGDKKMADFLFNIMENYVKKGSPPEKLQWDPVSPDTKSYINYLRIRATDEVEMMNDDQIGNVKYLKEVFDGIQPKKDEL